MNYIKTFLNYIFDPTPGSAFGFTIPMIILAVILILGAIAYNYYFQKRKKEDIALKRNFRNLSRNMLLFGIFFLILTGIRYENIPYFAMRFWMYLLVLGFLYSIYHYIQKYRTTYKKEQESISEKPVKVKEKRYIATKKRK